MTRLFPAFGSPSAAVRQNIWPWLCALTMIWGFWILLLGGQFNLLFALFFGGILVISAFIDPATSALLTLLYLNLLGDIRRLADLATGTPGLDLLLLVGPALACLIALPALFRLELRDRLSKTMLFLTALMFLEIFNPSQGGLAVGFSGALFYLAPMCWFWIGRHLGTPETIERLIYKVILPLGVVAAALGAYQVTVGFFPYQQVWIDATLKNYTALGLGGSTRAFGFSVSAAEYATLLEICAAIIIAAWFGHRRFWILALPLIVTSLVLASGRTVIIKLLFAALVTYAARKGKRLEAGTTLRLGLSLAAGVVVVMLMASQYDPGTSFQSSKRTATQNALTHLAGGLAHPFDEHYSTIGVHQSMFLGGISLGFKYPLGRGLGSTTGAAYKFGTSSSEAEMVGSEIDISDMFISLGFAGGIAYLYAVFLGMRSALLYSRRTARQISLPTLAVLSGTVGAWLISGQYSTSALVFFLIGATAHGAHSEDATLDLTLPTTKALAHA